MSMNVGARNVDRGKKSPSQNRSPKKCAASTKTETSKRGGKSWTSALPTIDKYLTKGSAAVSSKRTNNNKLCESNTKSTVESKLEVKPRDSKSETVSAENETRKTTFYKESSPESDIIVVDDVVSDLEIHNSAKANGKKQNAAGKLENKNNGGEERLIPSAPSNGEHCSEQKRLQGQENKLKSKNEEHSTGEAQSTENESEIETQEYELDRFEDARVYVDYKDDDFNTDSDFENSDSERQEQGEEEKGASSSGSKRKIAAMGIFGSKRRRRDACQGSSSEEEKDRPWKRSSSSHDTKQLKQYPLRSPRVTSLKRHWGHHDTQQYRSGYPDKGDNPTMNKNLDFYRGKIRSRPDGDYIDNFHQHWWTNHDRLESHHGYIQWLFPIRESGMNLHAQELQLHEAEAIRGDPKTRERFLQSYQMMLYFYGLRLDDKKTGSVVRADNWKSRFKHLNHSMHNYLRITRILKCLGEMGFEHYKRPLLELLLHEATDTRTLDRTLDSCCSYWIGTLRDDRERDRLTQRSQRAMNSAGSRF
ncbi:hypothetical protein ACOMHN_001341 [Nucella lapillus]